MRDVEEEEGNTNQIASNLGGGLLVVLRMLHLF
jgi:hypothetical protein